MNSLLAYSDATSYFPGDQVKLYVNSPAKFGFEETIETFKPNQNVKLTKTNVQGDLTLNCKINQTGSTPGVFTIAKLDSPIVKIFWDISTSNTRFTVNPHIVDMSGNKIYGIDYLKYVIESGNNYICLELPQNITQIKIFFLARGKFIAGDSFSINNFYVFNIVSKSSMDTVIQLFNIDKQIVLSYIEPNAIDQEFIKESFAEGCKWKQTSSFVIPSNLESGYYFIKVNYGSFFYLPIIIKSLKPNPGSVLLLANSNTWNAYNAWAGPEGSMSAYGWKPSLTYTENLKYKTKSTSTFVSNSLSFNRPDLRLHSEITNYIRYNMDTNIYLSHLMYSELYLVRYLRKLEIPYHIICDMDLHRATIINILNYCSSKLVVIQVHPEYWTERMIYNYNLIYKSMKTNLMYLGGNAMYWKVVIDQKNRIMEFKKDGSKHLLDGTTGGMFIRLYKSGYFLKKSNMLMIEHMLKIYYEHTYSRVVGKFNNPYVVKNSSSPLFVGIEDISNGMEICWRTNNTNIIDTGASGWEVDKCNYPVNFKYIIASDTQNLSDIIYVDDMPIKILSIGSITFTGSILYDPSSDIIIKNFFKEIGLITI